MQLLSETGIIGFLSVFLVFILTCFKLIKQFRNNHKLIPENILIIAIFINLPIIPTGNFFNNWLCMLYFIPISYYFYEINSKKKKKK